VQGSFDLATFNSINPFDETISNQFTGHTAEVINDNIHAAQDAFVNWRQSSFSERAERLRSLAQQVESSAQDLAVLITKEMGKPLTEAEAEIEKCASVCRYYAENGAQFLQDRPVKIEGSESFVSFQPLGIVLGIMPWNFPFWQVFRFAAPTLMAGNVAILKHAPNVFGCAEQIERLFQAAGFPKGIFSQLRLTNSETELLIADDRVQAVALTGSTRAGKAVAAAAGTHLKKAVLELGGNDAYLILEDADLKLAVETCAQSRLLNAGQSCIAAKRLLVHSSLHDEFVDQLKHRFQSQVSGDPLLRTTTLGPLARADLRDQLHRQVITSVQAGAKLVCGGDIPEGSGFFYPPTILTDVSTHMPAFQEELFGPVAAIMKFETEQEAIALANQSAFGLGAGVFSQNIEKAKRIARDELQAGSCFVNDFVKSHPKLPFGGIKQSGYGRELSSWGIHEFVNTKSVSQKL